MITKIRIKNFKKLDDVEIDLGSAVVFVGPNNSGKTSLLQAISLWELGMRRWAENRKKTSAKKRVGVTINRRDIVSIPVPSAVQLWQNLRVRKGVKENDRISTNNINKMGSPVLMDKSNYYELALLAKPDELDPEVLEKLDFLFIED